MESIALRFVFVVALRLVADCVADRPSAREKDMTVAHEISPKLLPWDDLDYRADVHDQLPANLKWQLQDLKRETFPEKTRAPAWAKIGGWVQRTDGSTGMIVGSHPWTIQWLQRRDYSDHPQRGRDWRDFTNVQDAVAKLTTREGVAIRKAELEDMDGNVDWNGITQVAEHNGGQYEAFFGTLKGQLNEYKHNMGALKAVGSAAHHAGQIANAAGYRYMQDLEDLAHFTGVGWNRMATDHGQAIARVRGQLWQAADAAHMAPHDAHRIESKASVHDAWQQKQDQQYKEIQKAMGITQESDA